MEREKEIGIREIGIKMVNKVKKSETEFTVLFTDSLGSYIVMLMINKLLNVISYLFILCLSLKLRNCVPKT